MPAGMVVKGPYRMYKKSRRLKDTNACEDIKCIGLESKFRVIRFESLSRSLYSILVISLRLSSNIFNLSSMLSAPAWDGRELTVVHV
jgi:hypothetical protein